MQETVQIWLNRFSKTGLWLTILSTLLLFTNFTTDFYDAPKFLILLAFSLILLILTALKFTFSNKVVILRTPLDLPLILLAAVAVISTVLSSAPYVSLLGQGGLIHNSLAAVVTYILFYFVVVNNLKNLKDVRQVTSLLILGGIILSVISLLVYAGLKILPPPWTHGVNFTPTGSNFSETAILALLVPILALEALTKPKLISKFIYAALLALFGVVIALTGTVATMAAALVGLALVLFLYRRQLAKFPNLENPGVAILASSLIIIAAVTAISLIPPFGKGQNPLYNLYKNFPREVQIPFTTSWKVSVSSFRDAPFWGSGPATYLFDFTSYKPVEFNATKFWNLRFDSAFNEYLLVLGTLGGVGLIALIFATGFFISQAYKVIKAQSHIGSEPGSASNLHLQSVGLAISGIVFFVILALHSSTLSVFVIGLLILACFMAVRAHLPGLSQARFDGNGFKQVLMRVASTINLDQTASETIRMEALPSVILTIAVALAGFAFFFAGKFALADFHHRNALNAVAQNQGLAAYNELVAAEKLNPLSDLYRTDLAQTNFALANAIAVAKGPTQASPSGSFTDQDRQNIQVLLQQAISEGRTATTLNPRSSLNWEILGSLYRQISGVAQNALLFALDSYGRAIQTDPLNPLLRLSVGGTYYAIQNYDMAIRFFTDSVNLKPDFANGFYNLSVAYRDKGDLSSALAAAQEALKLVDKNSQDYKAAQDYVKELESKVPTATKSADLTTPTAQDKGPLQQKDLPKVVDLPKPEHIATPSAVKKPGSTPEPTQSPTPSASPNQ